MPPNSRPRAKTAAFRRAPRVYFEGYLRCIGTMTKVPIGTTIQKTTYAPYEIQTSANVIQVALAPQQRQSTDLQAR